MNPMLATALGAIVRWVLALGAGYLVKAGIWSGTDAETYVAGAALALLSIGWSAWNKYRGQVELLIALQWARATKNDVKAHIASGGQIPALSTPPSTVPGVPAL